ncbi:MAG: hypothetical protein KGQ41_08560, partial [Alphaproteobacteria bacterium]|nr:hypothetical protein [Alphaproteobacteria bacterium]
TNPEIFGRMHGMTVTVDLGVYDAKDDAYAIAIEGIVHRLANACVISSACRIRDSIPALPNEKAMVGINNSTTLHVTPVEIAVAKRDVPNGWSIFSRAASNTNASGTHMALKLEMWCPYSTPEALAKAMQLQGFKGNEADIATARKIAERRYLEKTHSINFVP